MVGSWANDRHLLILWMLMVLHLFPVPEALLRRAIPAENFRPRLSKLRDNSVSLIDIII